MMFKYGNPIIILLYQAIYILLFYGYFTFIIPKYSYMGYEWHPDNLKIIEGLFFTFLISIFLSEQFKRPSDLLTHLLFIFPIIPMLVMYGAASGSRDYNYVMILSFAVILLITAIPFHLQTLKITELKAGNIVWLLTSITILYIVVIILMGGYRYFNINIWKVYEYREAAAANLPAYFGYLSAITGKIMLPMLFLFSLVNRKKFLMAVSLIGSFLIFALTSHKGPLIYPIVSLVVYYIYKNRFGSYLLLLSFCTVLLFSTSGPVLGKPGDIVGTLFLRRACFTPAKINLYYYKYFNDQAPLLWSESRITMNLLDYPYSEPSSKIVGRYIYNKEVSANTGWLGTGYMHAGFTGMLLYAFLIGVLLKFIDMLALNKDNAFVTAITAIPIMVIALSSDIPTVMLTHGFMILLFLLSCFKISQSIQH